MQLLDKILVEWILLDLKKNFEVIVYIFLQHILPLTLHQKKS